MSLSSRILVGSRAYFALRFGGAILLLVLVVIALSREKGVAREEREVAIERCVEERGADDCEVQIDANHDECFRYNYTQASKTAPAQFNRAWYYDCLMMGWDEFAKRRQEQFRKELERERETRAIVNDVLGGQ